MATSNNITKDPPYFGKYQRYVTIGCLLFYQFFMAPWGMLILFSIFTLNWNLLTIVVVICAIQFPIKKSEAFIKLVNKYIQPTNYFAKFTRIT
jgi:hypothetical protein